MGAQTARVSPRSVLSVIGAPGDEGRELADLFCSLLLNDTGLCENGPASFPRPLILFPHSLLHVPSLFLSSLRLGERKLRQGRQFPHS